MFLTYVAFSPETKRVMEMLIEEANQVVNVIVN